MSSMPMNQWCRTWHQATSLIMFSEWYIVLRLDYGLRSLPDITHVQRYRNRVFQNSVRSREPQKSYQTTGHKLRRSADDIRAWDLSFLPVQKEAVRLVWPWRLRARRRAPQCYNLQGYLTKKSRRTRLEEEFTIVLVLRMVKQAIMTRYLRELSEWTSLKKNKFASENKDLPFLAAHRRNEAEPK